MKEPRSENINGNRLAWVSGERDRRLGRSHRFLPLAVFGFVVLALCLMAEDILLLVGG